MKELKVIGAENGSLVLVSGDGERFVVAIDETLQAEVRPVRPPLPKEAKVSPREVQAHIRSGLTAAEVSELTGAAIEYVERFEGPVIAEREHVVASALSVRVHTALDTDPLEEGTAFGDIIRERLESLGARDERWTSWKDEAEGWTVKVSFTSDEIEHDARWLFDPRKGALAPANPSATTLSQQGTVTGTLIPRLRALAPVVDLASRGETPSFRSPATDDSDTAPQPRTPAEPAAPAAPVASASPTAPVIGSTGSFQRTTPQQRLESRERDLAQTSDLLDALRRRRGERETGAFDFSTEIAKNDGRSDQPTTDVPLDSLEAPAAPAEQKDRTGSQPSAAAPPAAPARGQGRRGRASMPSWDEIVFGARTDDD